MYRDLHYRVSLLSQNTVHGPMFDIESIEAILSKVALLKEEATSEISNTFICKDEIFELELILSDIQDLQEFFDELLLYFKQERYA